MAGYWGADAATREVVQDSWLRTGDLGTIDEDDFLVLQGRSAEVINRGGEKIYATQVEAALAEVPFVADAAVVGTPHPIFQERVVAVVVAREGLGFDEEAARRHLAEHVPDYAVPEAFALVDELPRNAAGKLDRAGIRSVAERLLP
jgi:acyl-CoA synthetase (AMP-forming)/AMP-acid ligase II